MENVDDDDMFGITIHNDVNWSNKPVGFSFRRKEQISSDGIWKVCDKVSQYNFIFKSLGYADSSSSFRQDACRFWRACY
jgi:hypothetical protein